MDSNFSLADLKAVMGEGGASGLIWLIVLFLFLGGGFGVGGNRGNAVTQQELNSAIAAQTSAMNQQAILLSSANNNYETARQIDTLGVNAIQGFNQITQAINQGFAAQGAAISQLGYNLDRCCCDIKTQMLQDRLADAQFALNAARDEIITSNQSLYLLSQLGKYTPGAAAASA